jgi:hypothetical protein
MIHRPSYGSLALRGVRHICGHHHGLGPHLPHLLHRLFERLDRACEQRQLGSQTGEPKRRGPADAGRAPRNEDYAPLKRRIAHSVSRIVGVGPVG